MKLHDKEIEENYTYAGQDLGVSCGDFGTVFKIWSPTADKILLRFFSSKTGELESSWSMEKGEKGVWTTSFSQNLHGTYYDYQIWRESEVVRTADPYAKAANTGGRKSMVVDLSRTNPDGFVEEKAPEKQEETIIYELHIKDFSFHEASGVPKEFRGKFKAFTVEKGEKPNCMDYLEELGVTHVHLLPMFDYASVDEEMGEDQFNWGYDPLNYNVPEGSYATEVKDGTTRIRECKEMVQALHKRGMRVIMDVVYNHTFSEDSWFGRTVPGYYYRYEEDGSLANGSACGNDFACGRTMVDNYILDSVLYWAKEYHIDGFRFDLMGLLTVELMNRIQDALDEIYGAGEKLLYGEPWSAGPSPMEQGTKPAKKENVAYLNENVAIFSDDTRDAIKGHVFYAKETGFVNGGKGFEEKILQAVDGWKEGDGFSPKACSQIIQYVSAHDNFTLWDKLVLTMQKKPDYEVKDSDILQANRLAALIYFTLQGHLFFQAGEEFARTKLGEDNSYCSSPELNQLDWNRAEEYKDLVEYYKGLIRLRKKLPGLCDKSKEACRRITEKRVEAEGVVSFQVENHEEGKQTWSKLLIVYNASSVEFKKNLPEGTWEILADGEIADCRCPVSARTVTIKAHTGLILGKL